MVAAVTARAGKTADLAGEIGEDAIAALGLDPLDRPPEMRFKIHCRWPPVPDLAATPAIKPGS